MRRNEIAARREALMERIMTEGAEAAYEAALELCRDSKAPSQARSAASNSILRAAGYFDKREDPVHAKQPYEMTGDELAAAVRRILPAADPDDDDNGIFE